MNHTHNTLIIRNIAQNRGGRTTIKFSVDKHLEPYFKEPYEFWYEYPETDVSSVPDGVAVVPFLANVLPIIWLTNAELIVPEIDATFFEAIPKIKKGYEDMYPMLDFGGKITPARITDNRHSEATSSAASICLFSGGVDAYCTLFRHLDERPQLLTLWGADIKLTDNKGWAVVNAQNRDAARKFGLVLNIVKSNFRTFINDGALNALVAASGDNYWHGFHHGAGIISHAAPLAWLKNLETVYIASSYTAADRGKYTCASDPTIDNHMKWGATHTVHDAYELTRQQKVHLICKEAERTGIKPELRVCWIETGGRNCCHCEKCLRTIFELIAEGRDPKEYGFDYTENDLRLSRKKVLGAYSRTIAPAWAEIRTLLSRMEPQTVPAGGQWILTCDFEKESRRVKRINALTSLPRRTAGKLWRLIHHRK